jgi:thymidylate synthase (FAD)
MPHYLSPDADKLLDIPFRVLDHGFVTLVDYMGNDQRIVDAARCSIAGEGVKAVSSNEGLIRYLMANRHTTPFEMIELTFHCKMPIFVARQWIRHRTANVNEMSGRYSELPEEFYVPELQNIQFQDKKNKQGRAEPIPEDLAMVIQTAFTVHPTIVFETYRKMLGQGDGKTARALAAGGGVARELSRVILPLSTYTAWYWKIDLHNLFHFLALRLDAHAQYEIRVYAEAMVPLVKAIAPMAYQAFEDFRLNAMTFSGPELKVLKRGILEVKDEYDIHGEPTEDDFRTKREREAYESKLIRLGIL